MLFIQTLSASLEKCTGCLVCALVCSMIYEGAFNPRSARITIVKTIAGVPKDIKISAVKCPICIKEGKNRCVELCPFDALKAVGI